MSQPRRMIVMRRLRNPTSELSSQASPDSLSRLNNARSTEGVTYNCRGHGALLLLPHGGRRADIIRTKAFEDYIRDHVVSWFTWAQKNQQGIERMEDIILVSGCTLVSSWAAAAFVYNTMEAKISLARRTLSNGGECFVWGNIRGSVEYHDSNIDPVRSPGIVYLAYTDFSFCMKSKFHLRLLISASSSGVSVQSASSSGPNQCGLPQNPALTTLITAATMRSK
jgi:hypothetical protein